MAECKWCSRTIPGDRECCEGKCSEAWTLRTKAKRLSAAYERAKWKLVGNVADSLRRTRKAKDVLARHMDETDAKFDALMGW